LPGFPGVLDAVGIERPGNRSSLTPTGPQRLNALEDALLGPFEDQV
jgi:hypothetical protein